MERFRYDRSSKWLIEHHGDSILRLAGVDDVIAWKPLPAEVVQPRQLPDGLPEVERRGRLVKDLFLIEIETYADRAIDEQVMDDVMLIQQARGVVPETVLLVLRPKGQAQVLGSHERSSASGQTRLAGRWPVVELWQLPAEAMLALKDPGLVPWIPLMASAKPPEQLLQECRTIIDEKAKREEVGNLLVVAQVLAGLRYNDRWLFSIFGGREAMIESPIIKELLEEVGAEKLAKGLAEGMAKGQAEGMAKGQAEGMAKGRAEGLAKAITHILKKQFGNVPADIVARLQQITDVAELERLTDWALACPDLDSFRQQLK